jgi:AAA+ superfamily predicted ATPase
MWGLGLVGKTAIRTLLRAKWLHLQLDLSTAEGHEGAQAALEREGEFAKESLTLETDREHIFQHIADTFKLTKEDILILECLAVLELPGDVVHRLRAVSRNEASGPFPQVEVLLQLLARGNLQMASLYFSRCQPGALLRRYQLVDVDDEARPTRFAPIRLAKGVMRVLFGEKPLASGYSWHEGGAETLAPEAEHVCAARTFDEKGRLLLFVSGSSGTGQRDVVFAAARTLNRPVLRISSGRLEIPGECLADACARIARDAMLTNAVVFIDGVTGDEDPPRALGPSRNIIEALAEHPIALAIGADTDEVDLNGVMRPIVRIKTRLPNAETRAALWRRYLPEQSAEGIACAFALSAKSIEDAAHSARMRAMGDVVTEDDARRAARAAMTTGKVFGQDPDYRPRLADLIVSRENSGRLTELLMRVRHRRRVVEEWGFSGIIGRQTGVSAIFYGPPGTGKSMSAHALASELAVECLRIDLSQVVSKWIGETEKQLAKVFDVAERSDALLLFDEADALFTKRTDVKSSNDHHANLQIDYLLQRLESFPGLAILTTNRLGSIDPALMRRLSAQVAFSHPNENERRLLWERKLPKEAPLAENVNFDELAKAYMMTGARIRNVALRAAFYAADAGTPITQEYLKASALVEYRGAGWNTPSTMQFLE